MFHVGDRVVIYRLAVVSTHGDDEKGDVAWVVMTAVVVFVVAAVLLGFSRR